MNNQYSKNESGDRSQHAPANATDNASIPHSAILGPDGKPIPIAEKPEAPQETYRKIADAESRISKWVVIWAGVTALATVSQIGIAVYSNRSTGKTQTDQFNQMKSVADRMEGAAKSFAGSAANINQGIDNTTAQLQIQAEATQTAANTAAAQLRLTRQSLAATSAATCNGSIQNRSHFPYMYFFVACDEGKVDATLLSGSFDVSVEDMQTGEVTKTTHFTVPAPQLAKHVQEIHFDIDGFDMAKFYSLQQMVRIKGQITYDDGFGRSFSHPFCFAILPNRNSKGVYAEYVQTICDARVGDILRHYKEEDEKSE